VAQGWEWGLNRDDSVTGGVLRPSPGGWANDMSNSNDCDKNRGAGQALWPWAGWGQHEGRQVRLVMGPRAAGWAKNMNENDDDHGI